MAKALLTLRVNGEAHTVAAEPHHTLLEVLREELGLTGTKHGCELGECGACTVLVDGRPVNACLFPALEVDGADVVTIEGLTADPIFAVMEEAFTRQAALQCGFCTSGMLLTIKALFFYADDGYRDPGLGGRLISSSTYRGYIQRNWTGGATAFDSTDVLVSSTYYVGALGDEVADYSYAYRSDSSTVRTTSVNLYANTRPDGFTDYVRALSADIDSPLAITEAYNGQLTGAETSGLIHRLLETRVSTTSYVGEKGEEIANYSYTYRMGGTSIKNHTIYYYGTEYDIGRRADAVGTDRDTAMNRSDSFRTNEDGSDLYLLSKTFYNNRLGKNNEIADYALCYYADDCTKVKNTTYSQYSADMRATSYIPGGLGTDQWMVASDQDWDGIPDLVEIARYGHLGYGTFGGGYDGVVFKDTDHDGIDDAVAKRIWTDNGFTGPFNMKSDKDHDGILDIVEAAMVPFAPNPLMVVTHMTDTNYNLVDDTLERGVWEDVQRWSVYGYDEVNVTNGWLEYKMDFGSSQTDAKSVSVWAHNQFSQGLPSATDVDLPDGSHLHLAPYQFVLAVYVRDPSPSAAFAEDQYAGYILITTEPNGVDADNDGTPDSLQIYHEGTLNLAPGITGEKTVRFSWINNYGDWMDGNKEPRDDPANANIAIHKVSTGNLVSAAYADYDNTLVKTVTYHGDRVAVPTAPMESETYYDTHLGKGDEIAD